MTRRRLFLIAAALFAAGYLAAWAAGHFPILNP